MNTCRCVVLIFMILCPGLVIGGDDVASSLLEATCNARDVTSGIALKFKYNSAGSGLLECELYQLGERRKVISRSDTLHQIVWYDGEYAWIWRGDDLVRAQPKYIVDHGEFCFDANTIGVATTLDFSFDLDLLIRKKFPVARMELPEEWNGISCEVVGAIYDTAKIRYFIEEPTLRIHRIVATMNDGDYSQRREIESSFSDNSSTFSWLPMSVKCAGSDEMNDWQITDITPIDRKVSEEDFTIQSTDIPVGTAVIDVDQQYRLGYWTGSVIDENFSSNGDIPDNSLSSTIYFYSALGAIICAVAYILFRMKRRA